MRKITGWTAVNVRDIKANLDTSNMDGEFDSEAWMFGDVILDEDEEGVYQLPSKY